MKGGQKRGWGCGVKEGWAILALLALPELRSGSVGVGPKITHSLSRTHTHRIERSDGTVGR